MKNVLRLAIILTLGAALGFADLTTAQKLADFNQLAAMYAKRYGPYEWKRDVIGFDLLNLQPWLDRAANTTSDLDFYELCIEYVSSLNDAHDLFTLQSNFQARLGFAVDIYDGVTLIDSITRSALPVDKYPFQIGDELVSIDGKTTTDLLPGLLRYEVAANERSTRRLAAQLLTVRPQSRMPHAHEIGDSATVVIRRQNGDLETYTIPWTKTGTPLLSAGFPLSPYSAQPTSRISAAALFDTDAMDDSDPEYLDALKQLWNVRLAESPVAVLNFGSLAPIYALPAGFKMRLGNASGDEFVTGTFQAGGYTIGYIRIASYAPSSTSNALRQFQTEIAFLQQNTDGLVVDEMRNPGGSVCYDETLVSYLVPGNWRPLGFALRATQDWIRVFASNLQFAKDQNAPQWVINLYAAFLKEVQQAYSENRGMTGPLPLCTPSLERQAPKDSRGNVIAYTKPLIVLTDEMSASGADAFPAMLQDAQRGPIVGWRTMGAGGNVIDVPATTYSGGNTRVTESMMVRKNPVTTTDFPSAPYVENVGVRPDIQIDYMTKDNLLQRGKPFVDAFTQVIVDQIKNSK